MTPEQIAARKEAKRVFSNKYNLCKRLGITRDQLPDDVFQLMRDEKALFNYLMGNREVEPLPQIIQEASNSNIPSELTINGIEYARK